MRGRKTPKERVLALRALIAEHDKRYYELDDPTISDSEYDQLVRELRELEDRHPELRTPDSPTQKVGGAVSSSFAPVRHARPMLSLDNTYNADEIRAWDERVRKNLPPGQAPVYVVERKLDGLSCALTYENGRYVRAATRGDGETGEDVTENVRGVELVPRTLKDGPKGLIEVRGEVVLRFKDFEAINAEEKAAGRPGFVNPRNCAAGSLRQKDARITARRHLQFYAHSYGTWDDGLETHSGFLESCAAMGFHVEPYSVLGSVDEVIAFYESFKGKLAKLPYAADGLVVKVDSFAQQKRLGFTAKSPRWAVAFKYPAQQVTSEVLDIWPSVGRTGTITPIAKVQPVFCGGVTISNVSLHNYDEVERLGVRAGDRVLIERAGEVIPHILKVAEKAARGKAVGPPKNCPACGGPVLKEEGQVAWFCDNPSCPAQVRGTLYHFSGRAAMDIEGLGESAIDQLVTRGLVKDPADLYALTREQLLELDLFAELKADNLLKRIEASKEKTLDRVLYGLGIRHVGEKTAETIAERLDVDQLLAASEQDLQAIPEIGPIVARSIAGYFGSPAGKSLVARLRKAGVRMAKPERRVAEGWEHAGKSFVFTGELSTMTREEAEELVKAAGGKTSGSVSAKTGFVVAGEAAGSKLKRALALGVPVLTEEQFKGLLPR